MLSNGLHTLDADAYHRDVARADVPSLSSSIAHLLCTSSPAHARAAHPRLNPDLVRRESSSFDVGTAAHDVILEQGKREVAIIDADSWRTNAAKDARTEARAAGNFAFLRHEWDAIQEMTLATFVQLAELEVHPAPFSAGKPEQTLIWEEAGGVVCRARLDWLHDDHTHVDDLKTTAKSANPEAWAKNLYANGADVQAAFYLRGLHNLTGARAEYRWVVQESSPPYALSVVSPAPSVLVLAEKKVEYALRLWRQCLERNDWPGYPRRVCYAELPAWEEERWLSKEVRDDSARY
jgi:hypothetical protein